MVEDYTEVLLHGPGADKISPELKKRVAKSRSMACRQAVALLTLLTVGCHHGDTATLVRQPNGDLVIGVTRAGDQPTCLTDASITAAGSSIATPAAWGSDEPTCGPAPASSGSVSRRAASNSAGARRSCRNDRMAWP